MTGARLAVVGASGRMGRAVVRLAGAHGFTLSRAIARTRIGEDAGSVAGVGPLGVQVEDDLGALASGGHDVVVDFSSPAVTLELANLAAKTGAALVTGTTGFGADVEAALVRASSHAALLWEPNLSLGVHVLLDLARRAALALGDDFDVEVTETHHRKKVDAPSGTAARLVETLLGARSDPARVTHGRSGRPGPRPRGEIGVHAIRGGDVVGDHTVHFLGDGERLELTHRATDRDVFARGALSAAGFVVGKAPGRYRMVDLVSS